MRIALIAFLLCFISYAQNGDNSPVKAFPDAYGPGATVTGGRNGVLIIVNTTDVFAAKSGPFTNAQGETYYTSGYAQALIHNGPAYIVFNVSGAFDLSPTNPGYGGMIEWAPSRVPGVSFYNSRGIGGVADKSVFGQSAPRGGVTFYNGNHLIGGYDNAVRNLSFRYIKSRPWFSSRDGTAPPEAWTKVYLPNKAPGDDNQTSAFGFTAGIGMIVDHISASFAHDKGITQDVREQNNQNVFNCPCPLQNVTWSNNLVSSNSTNVRLATNPNRPDDPQLVHNDIGVYANVIHGANRTPNMGFTQHAEAINNVIHQAPNKLMRVYHDIELNHIANYYTDTNSYNWVSPQEPGATPSIYTSQNIFEGNSVSTGGYTQSFTPLTGNIAENNEVIWINGDSRDAPANPAFFTGTEHTTPWTYKYPFVTAQQAYTNLITNGDVGAYKYLDNEGFVQIYRDDFDATVLSNIASGSSWNNKTIATWPDPRTLALANTRPASYDTDNDGMADAWELREFGNLNQGYGGDFDGDGYENIEEYMMQVDSGLDSGGGGAPPPTGPPTGNIPKNKRKTQAAQLIHH